MRRIGIDYRDVKGALTRRTIVVRKVQRVGDDALVTAWCETRKAVRVFRASRMEALFDPRTGEIGDPAKAFGLAAAPRSAPTSPFRRTPFRTPPRQDRAAQALVGIAACVTLIRGARLAVGVAQKAAPILKHWQAATPDAARALSDRISTSVPSRAELIEAVRSIEPPSALTKIGRKLVSLLPIQRR